MCQNSHQIGILLQYGRQIEEGKYAKERYVEGRYVEAKKLGLLAN
jgi:hypothetical protein